MSGTVFEITNVELAAADPYEQLAAYKRVAAMLARRAVRRRWQEHDSRRVHDFFAVVALPQMLHYCEQFQREWKDRERGI